MADVSVREVCAYVVDGVLNELAVKMLDDSYFESEAFHAFMSEYFPTYKITKVRKEKMKEHFGKLLERAQRPVKVTLSSYDKD